MHVAPSHLTLPGLWHPGHHTCGCLRVRPQAVSQMQLAVRLRMRISWDPSQPPRSPEGGRESGREDTHTNVIRLHQNGQYHHVPHFKKSAWRL
jgi:hypothetical protein